MSVLENFDRYNDLQIKKLLSGKTIHILYKDGSSKKGVVTNFISAALTNIVNRSIVGIIIDNEDEIVISKDIITKICILN